MMSGRSGCYGNRMKACFQMEEYCPTCIGYIILKGNLIEIVITLQCIIKKWNVFFQNGFAQEAEKESTNNRVWCLTHFGVQNANKPNKVRWFSTRRLQHNRRVSMIFYLLGLTY